MDDCLDLESSFEMVSAARAFVHSRLSAWELHDHIDDALLIASELVTNAILHARTPVQLRLHTDGPAVRVEVYDENSRMPAITGVGPDATSGRGLAVVACLARAWGMEQEGHGKVVWAELGSEARVESDDDCLDLKGVDSIEQALDRVDRTSRRTADA
jgi:anti-sigma regulatory factor (Ser/Thr protein kinase)